MTDDTTDTTPTDDQFPTDSSASVSGRRGIGKTTRFVGLMAAVSDHDETEPEWVDPKSDPDAQNDDVPRVNPLDISDDSPDESGETTGDNQ